MAKFAKQLPRVNAIADRRLVSDRRMPDWQSALQHRGFLGLWLARLIRRAGAHHVGSRPIFQALHSGVRRRYFDSLVPDIRLERVKKQSFVGRDEKNVLGALCCARCRGVGGGCAGARPKSG